MRKLKKRKPADFPSKNPNSKKPRYMKPQYNEIGFLDHIVKEAKEVEISKNDDDEAKN